MDHFETLTKPGNPSTVVVCLKESDEGNFLQICCLCFVLGIWDNFGESDCNAFIFLRCAFFLSEIKFLTKADTFVNSEVN